MIDPWVESNRLHLPCYSAGKWLRYERKWVGILQRHTHRKLEKTCIIDYNPGLWELKNRMLRKSHIYLVTPSLLRALNESRLAKWMARSHPSEKSITVLCTIHSHPRGGEPTSRLLRVLNSIRSWSLMKASLEYWKLNVENGVSGSSKMSKSAKSFSSSVSRGTPESELNQLINDTFINTRGGGKKRHTLLLAHNSKKKKVR